MDCHVTMRRVLLAMFDCASSHVACCRTSSAALPGTQAVHDLLVRLAAELCNDQLPTFDAQIARMSSSSIGNALHGLVVLMSAWARAQIAAL